MYYFKPVRNVRDEILDAIDVGLVDKDYLISAMLDFMSVDDIKKMLTMNEISLSFEDEDEDENEEDSEEEENE